jgi:hypothetical protein
MCPDKSLAATFDHHLLKPIDFDALVSLGSVGKPLLFESFAADFPWKYAFDPRFPTKPNKICGACAAGEWEVQIPPPGVRASLTPCRIAG